MLSVEHVTKRYGAFTALEDISLTFSSGVCGLLAPNGAGKTTLIKMLTTLLFPTEGQILWDGEDILSMGSDYRGLLGYLPQEFGYYPNYTPKQFLRYAAALQCIPRQTADQRIVSLLEVVGLSDSADRKLKKFSGGMLQRVGIAVAMLNDPRLLILDEPTAGLDPRERVRFRSLIHSLSKDRIVILSTHIVSDIETIASQIVMLRDHRLYCCESPAAICGRFRGKVFEVPADTPLTGGQYLLSEGQRDGGTVLRILSDAPPQTAVAVTPGLEDAFLAIYREEGRS
ncbi:ABC transporter ATP-binding protein [Oscillibacter sp. MSJ-2]|uniref:ABC transporter ATP-binding protein n=1 Tax=Dysosmobacter acutus TaxID=2841504 RepID=A0ABS6F871_9FIRM|nr:ABC transporter ATP-binding protein [Dysosmobacter acutus]MBU5625494.1 ABC transporter ATP-binding protein [Dysosmobacter acutus]